MSGILSLLEAYDRQLKLPWRSISASERVWIAIYRPRDERRLRLRIPEFELRTTGAGKRWSLIDVTDSLPRMLGNDRDRDMLFADPQSLDLVLETTAARVADEVVSKLVAPEHDSETVTGLLGVGALFGACRVSTLMEQVEANVQGRLLVFFPGRREGANYRLLDARDGWNYHAIPIEAGEVAR